MNITEHKYIDLEELSPDVFNVWRGDSDRTDLLGKIKRSSCGFNFYPQRGANDTDSMFSADWLRDVVSALDELEGGGQ